jgi:hypothetical protein
MPGAIRANTVFFTGMSVKALLPENAETEGADFSNAIQTLTEFVTDMRDTFATLEPVSDRGSLHKVCLCSSSVPWLCHRLVVSAGDCNGVSGLAVTPGSQSS